jgi:hypothetical protein
VWLVDPAGQVSSEQLLPDEYSMHPPAPLHLPLRPQDGAPSSGQSPSEGLLRGTGAQVPTLPATLHDRHEPEQSLLQHTPSTQNEDEHSLARVQDAPFSFLGVQRLLLQKAD